MVMVAEGGYLGGGGEVGNLWQREREGANLNQSQPLVPCDLDAAVVRDTVDQSQIG